MNDPKPQKPQRAWFRFSIRTMLLCCTLLTLGLSWFVVRMEQAKQQQLAVEEVWKEAGYQAIRYDSASGQRGVSTAMAPAWLQKQLGEDFFSRVISARGLRTNAGLAHLKAFPYLRELDLWAYDSEVTDAGLQNLQRLSRLEVLSLRATKITDAGLAHLKGLDRLRSLELYQTQITGTGLHHLQGLKQLRSLDLSRTLVKDDGLAPLKEFKQLESLNLWATQITDAGLTHLYGLDQLRSFDVNAKEVTQAGLLKLQQALPHCDIHPLTATTSAVPEQSQPAAP